jgi:parallel beta-helix repeat protein
LVAPCALAEGLNQAEPGDEVILRDGVYYEGAIDSPHLGTPGAPIVIRSYPGEMAVWDGADPATFTWMAQGGGVYRTTVNTGDPHLILANGERLYSYQSLADLQNLIWGIPGFYADGVTVYVRLKNDANPNDTEMVVSRHNEAFHVKDWMIISNLTFRHYGQGEGARALTMYNAAESVVQDCTFALNDTGIVIKYNSHRNVIQNNEFYDTISNWPWEAVKDDINLGAGAIRWGSSTPPTGNVVRYNTVHGMFDGLQTCPY